MLKSTFYPLLCGRILLGKYYLQCAYNENHILSKKIYENHIEN